MNPAHVDDFPLVTRTHAGTVTVELSGPHAETLAKLIAHYDAMTSTTEGLRPVAHYEPDVWHHTLVSLLAEKALLRGAVAATVDVAVDDVAFCPVCGQLKSDRRPARLGDAASARCHA